MNKQINRMLLIKLPYWLGIAADALWTVGLLSLPVFRILTGNPDFNPDFQTSQILAIAGILMMGWTFLLVWAVRKPIERRGVALLTIFPVACGLFIVTLRGILNGNTGIIWVLVKISILVILMIASFILAGKMEREGDQS